MTGGLERYPRGRLPTIPTVPVAVCPLCGHGEATSFAEGFDYELETCGNLWRFVQCRECRHVRLDPRPAESTLGTIYPSTYYAYNYESKVHPIAMRAKAWLDEKKLGGILGLLGRPATSYLDVGCGNGRFLKAMERRGVSRERTFGLELDAAVAGRLSAAGYPVERARVEDATTVSNGSVDLITLFHVIEHVADPGPVVDRLAAWLAPGGLLALETPNRDSLDARVFGRTAWGGYHFPRHWNLFDTAGVRRLLERAGLSVEAVRYQTGHSFWLYSIHHLLRYGRVSLPWLARRFDPVGALVSLAAVTGLEKIRIGLGLRTSAVLVVARKGGTGHPGTGVAGSREQVAPGG